MADEICNTGVIFTDHRDEKVVVVCRFPKDHGGPHLVSLEGRDMETNNSVGSVQVSWSPAPAGS